MMTREEIHRRFLPVWNSKGMTPQQINEAVEAMFLAQRGDGPPARHTAASAQPRRLPSRDDHSEAASAPYRFVPYVPDALVKAEPAALEPIHKPKPGGLSARIQLRWTAEAPLLIGDQGEGSPTEVVPLRLNDGDDGYIIPGSTIRGAIRSIAEIAGAGRLRQVNRERLFGLRDFNHSEYGSPESPFPVLQPKALRAGWLRLRADHRLTEGHHASSLAVRGTKESDYFNSAFELIPCERWYAVEADEVRAGFKLDLRHLPEHRRPQDGKAFTRLGMADKYRALGAWHDGAIHPTKVTHSFLAERAGANDRGWEAAPRAFPSDQKVGSEGAAFAGHLVFSGATPPPGKRLEYVFPRYDRAVKGPTISAERMIRFRRLNSRAIDDKLQAEGNWQLALSAFMRNSQVAIPVFFVGDPATEPEDSADDRFFMGLTRLFKVPHRWSFEEVLENSHVGSYQLPPGQDRVMPDELDMVDALFGYVFEPPEGTKPAPAEVARKGRVAFSAAHLPPGTRAQIRPAIDTVMMGPKPSFAPFYLAKDEKGFLDYSSPAKPRIAGRKRYPPREAGAGGPQAALAGLRQRLELQVSRIHDMTGKPPGNQLVTRLRFLLPAENSTLAFTSEVRLFNVTQAELGLVLWALTFGGEQHKYRHMLGRAKGFGAGQLKLDVTGLDVEWNEEKAPTGFEKIGPGHFTPFLDRFQDHVAPAGRARDRWLAIIEALRNTADPELGQEWAMDGKLDTMLVSQKVNGRTVQHFQRLRDMMKPDRNGTPPMGDTVLLPMRSRRPTRGGR